MNTCTFDELRCDVGVGVGEGAVEYSSTVQYPRKIFIFCK